MPISYTVQQTFLFSKQEIEKIAYTGPLYVIAGKIDENTFEDIVLGIKIKYIPSKKDEYALPFKNDEKAYYDYKNKTVKWLEDELNSDFITCFDYQEISLVEASALVRAIKNYPDVLIYYKEEINRILKKNG